LDWINAVADLEHVRRFVQAANPYYEVKNLPPRNSITGQYLHLWVVTTGFQVTSFRVVI